MAALGNPFPLIPSTEKQEARTGNRKPWMISLVWIISTLDSSSLASELIEIQYSGNEV